MSGGRVKAGTRCHNGHKIEATYKIYVTIEADGSVTRSQDLALDPDGIYCEGDCELKPATLRAAERLLIADGADPL